MFVCLCAKKRKNESEREKRREGSGVLLDGLTHIQAHLHAVPGVVRQRLGQPRHAVVTVTQDLDPHAFVFLKEWIDNKKKSHPVSVNDLHLTITLGVRSIKPRIHTPTHAEHMPHEQ